MKPHFLLNKISVSLVIFSIFFTQIHTLSIKDDQMLVSKKYGKIKVKEILESSKIFDQNIFDKLLTRFDSEHIFLSDVNDLIFSMQEDYPDVVSVSSIGQSWEGRDINLVTIDGLKKVLEINQNQDFKFENSSQRQSLSRQIKSDIETRQQEQQQQQKFKNIDDQDEPFQFYSDDDFFFFSQKTNQTVKQISKSNKLEIRNHSLISKNLSSKNLIKMNQSSVKDSKVKVKNQTLAKNYSSIHNLKKKSENEWKELVPPKKDIHEIKEMVNMKTNRTFIPTFLASSERPAIMINAAHHARELITIQMALFQALKLMHEAFVVKDKKFKNLMAQNVYYIVPVVNPDGVAFIEQTYNMKQILPKKRKNMSPMAMRSDQGYDCPAEDSGVDLNRNYPLYWGLSKTYDVGGGKQYDECSDKCGECYRGQAPLSEPETSALADFISSKKDQLKFVANLHSEGNMWIYPYNGIGVNNIEKRNPEAFSILNEISNQATFPEGNKHGGNSQNIMDEIIGGDMDDWILDTFNIPAVTNELGEHGQFINSWQVRSKEEALKICEDNTPWLEYTYQKLGTQLSIKPIDFQKINKEEMVINFEIKNMGLSDFKNSYTVDNYDKLQLNQITNNSKIAQNLQLKHFQPIFKITKSNFNFKIVDVKIISNTGNQLAQQEINQNIKIDGNHKFELGKGDFNLKSRESKKFQILLQLQGNFEQKKDFSKKSLKIEMQFPQFSSNSNIQKQKVILEFQEKKFQTK